MDQIRSQDKIIIIGNLYTRIGNEPLCGVMQRLNKETMNENGELLNIFCAYNNMMINNTFFKHNMKYKCTWQKTRRRLSVLNYVITKKEVDSQTILDVKTLNDAN